MVRREGEEGRGKEKRTGEERGEEGEEKWIENSNTKHDPGGKFTLYEGGVRGVSFVHSALLPNPGETKDNMMRIQNREREKIRGRKGCLVSFDSIFRYCRLATYHSSSSVSRCQRTWETCASTGWVQHVGGHHTECSLSEVSDTSQYLNTEGREESEGGKEGG